MTAQRYICAQAERPTAPRLKKSIVRHSVALLLSAHAHYPSYHSDSSPYRKLAHVGLCACGLGLLSRRRFAPPDYSRCPPGESLAGPRWLIVRRCRPASIQRLELRRRKRSFSASRARDRAFQRGRGLGRAAFPGGEISLCVEMIGRVMREGIHRHPEIRAATREMPV